MSVKKEAKETKTPVKKTTKKTSKKKDTKLKKLRNQRKILS